MASRKRQNEEDEIVADGDEVRAASRTEKSEIAGSGDDRRLVRLLSTSKIAVDFEFFDLRPLDRQAIRNLLQQLLSHDAAAVDLGGLADAMIEREEAIGSTVKCDGIDSDPYAFCSLVDPVAQKANAAVTELTNYLTDRVKSAGKAGEPISRLLRGENAKPALVLSERLVNMPAQIVAPMLRMLHEEASTLGAAFAFTHLLLLSRVFVAGSADLDDAVQEDDSKLSKKQKKRRAAAAAAQASANSVFAYHAEDEVIAQFATSSVDFPFKSAPSRAHGDVEADAFGVETRGRLSALPWSELPALVAKLEEYGSM